MNIIQYFACQIIKSHILYIDDYKMMKINNIIIHNLI